MDLILAPVQAPVAACPNSWNAIVSISGVKWDQFCMMRGLGGRTEGVQDFVEDWDVP